MLSEKPTFHSAYPMHANTPVKTVCGMKWSVLPSLKRPSPYRHRDATIAVKVAEVRVHHLRDGAADERAVYAHGRLRRAERPVEDDFGDNDGVDESDDAAQQASHEGGGGEGAPSFASIARRRGRVLFWCWCCIFDADVNNVLQSRRGGPSSSSEPRRRVRVVWVRPSSRWTSCAPDMVA